MIKADQPTIFPSNIVTAVSSVSDGNMKRTTSGASSLVVDTNRRNFLSSVNISPSETVLVHVTYDTDNFTRYKQVGAKEKGDGITQPIDFQADALATNEKNVALFLPLADCVGAVFYDKKKNVLMVSHLGRHNIEQSGAGKNVLFLENTFHCQPADLLVWLGPAPSKASYPLFTFDGKSLHEVTREQLLQAGVKNTNIEICQADTAIDKNYFSHSEFKKGKRAEDGRFALLASMR